MCRLSPRRELYTLANSPWHGNLFQFGFTVVRGPSCAARQVKVSEDKAVYKPSIARDVVSRIRRLSDCFPRTCRE